MINIGSSCVGVKLDNDTIHVDWNPIKRPILSHKRGLNMGKHDTSLLQEHYNEDYKYFEIYLLAVYPPFFTM